MRIKKIDNFYDLEAWECAHQLTLRIYEITRNFPHDELYGIISQLRRAATSVTANIAEGFSRYHFKDKINFYYHARGSVSEVESFFFVARDLHYIRPDQFAEICQLAISVRRLINGLIKSIDKQLKAPSSDR